MNIKSINILHGLIIFLILEPTPTTIRISHPKDFKEHRCTLCQRQHVNKEDLLKHYVLDHPAVQQGTGNDTGEPLNVTLSRKMFKNTLQIYEVDLRSHSVRDVDEFYDRIRNQMLSIMNSLLGNYKNYRIHFDLVGQFAKQEDNNIRRVWPYIESFTNTVENSEYAETVFNLAKDHHSLRVEAFEQNGSNWILERIDAFRIIITKVRRIGGKGGIKEIPQELRDKYRTLVNIPSVNGDCFKRCIIAALTAHTITNRIHEKLRSLLHYKPYLQKTEKLINPITNTEINFEGVDNFFSVKQVKKFEGLNPGIGLNIICYDECPDNIFNGNPEADIEISENNFLTDSSEQITNMQIDIDSDDDVINAIDLYDFGGDDLSEKQIRVRRKVKKYHDLRKSLYPLVVCKEEKKLVIDLLLVQQGDDGHYCLITNFKGFLKHPCHGDLKEICRYCLQNLGRMTFKNHAKYCAGLGLQKTVYPKEKYLEFTNWKATVKKPFTIFADFEACVVPLKVPKKLGNTTITHEHIANSYGIAVIDRDHNIERLVEYISPDPFKENVSQLFLRDLIKIKNELLEQIKEWQNEATKNAKKYLDGIEKANKGEKCFFCGDELDLNNCHRHHDHYYPYEFLGHACAKHNMNAKVDYNVNCYLMNLQGYDSHFILKAASPDIVKEIEVIGSSSEKFSCLKIDKNLWIMDALKFFHSSLDAVVKTLNKDAPITKKYFTEIYGDSAKVDLLLQKGLYPYSHMKTKENFDETSLPPIEKFTNDLTNTPCTQLDYAHATNVWNELDVRNMREYTRIYLICDVLLLSDCFERLRDTFIGKFGVDPAHYFSLPQLSFDCCLKHTKAKLEYVKDPTMWAFLESSKRGGMSCGGDIRAFKANNKYVPGYDKTKPNTWISIQDLNNLYPTALTYTVPVGEFKWVKDDIIQNLQTENDMKKFILTTSDEADEGYFYEVDLEFPLDDASQRKFNALTPAPYKRVINREEISLQQERCHEELGESETVFKAERLIADYHPRKNYIVHYRVLQFYINIGLKVTKIHRALQFKQEAIFKSYVELVTQLRVIAPTKAEQNFWKLALNCLYGKCGEDVRKRKTYKIVRDETEAQRYLSKPNVSRIIVLDGEPDMVIVCFKSVSVYLNKPIYIATTVLDESKRIYYNYFYTFAQPTWDDPSKNRALYVAGGDTDSVMLCVQTDNIYEDMLENEKDWFDLSNFPTTGEFSKYHSDRNIRKLSYMKDEAAGKVISHFMYIKPKMYMYQYHDNFQKKNDESEYTEWNQGVFGQWSSTIGCVKKGKGIPAVSLARDIDFGMFEQCLETTKSFTVKYNSIQSKKHEIFSMQHVKKGLSSSYYKRYVLDDCINTLPYGHVDIKEYYS